MNQLDVRRVDAIDHLLDAVVDVPGSKSIANRALMCAALAQGSSTITGLPDGDDTEAMLEGLVALGARINRSNHDAVFQSGITLDRDSAVTVNARLAGTTSRFLTALCGLISGPTLITGEPKLLARPMDDLHNALSSLGVQISWEGERGHLPVMVSKGKTVQSSVSLPGSISSQFTSALLLIAPLFESGLIISMSGEVISRPYIDMTITVMRAFGAEISTEGSQLHVLPGGYRGSHFDVEPDASSASYPLAAAAIVGGSVEVRRLGRSSIQGDARFADLLEQMGCDVRRTDQSVSVFRGKTTRMKGIDVDMRDMSDLVPTLAAVAAFASSPTTIRGVGFIRAKESNRIEDLVNELRNIGVHASATPDGLIVEPSQVGSGVVNTHHDHRLAMAFAVMGLGVGGVEICDPSVVTKSWPEFWSMLASL
jgi:3-phosphoshikimate 1-carboxyvinyltransferase